MTSKTWLNILVNQRTHGKHYEFIYKDLQKIIDHGENKGDTRVRFVSRSLLRKHDNFARHVFLEFQRRSSKEPHPTQPMDMQIYISEHNPSWARYTSVWRPDWKDEISIQLPNIHFDMDDIIEHEQTLPNMYMLGVRDCRHHVSDMLHFCYTDILTETDITNIP
jgi:hypothetical protein